MKIPDFGQGFLILWHGNHQGKFVQNSRKGLFACV